MNSGMVLPVGEHFDTLSAPPGGSVKEMEKDNVTYSDRQFTLQGIPLAQVPGNSE